MRATGSGTLIQVIPGSLDNTTARIFSVHWETGQGREHNTQGLSLLPVLTGFPLSPLWQPST